MLGVRQAYQGLQKLFLTEGIPEHMITDNHKSQGGGVFTKDIKWQELIEKFHINSSFTESHSPWQNRCEQEVKQLQHNIRKFTSSTNSPKRLWCFLGEYVIILRRFYSFTKSELQG